MRRLAVLLLALPLTAAVCPQGTVQGTRPDNCYLYGSAQSWQEAEHYPKLFESAQSYWLGAELKSAAAKWTWTDDSDFTYTKWASGEPNQGPGCLYMDASTGQWHSGDCDASKPFICKVPPSCKPAPQKCEDGWTYNEKLNKCYKASGTDTLSGVFNWDSAYEACLDLGANLPSIHNDEENLAFSEVARRYPYVVLGLMNTAWSEGGETRVYNFMWTDGSFFDYSMLRSLDGEYHKCAFFEKAKADEWITMDCLKPDYMATAICQKKPKNA